MRNLLTPLAFVQRYVGQQAAPRATRHGSISPAVIRPPHKANRGEPNGKHHPPVQLYTVYFTPQRSTTAGPPLDSARDSTGRVHARLAAPPSCSTTIYRSSAFMALRDLHLLPTPPAARDSSAGLGL
jgi:hypothetical protein